MKGGYTCPWTHSVTLLQKVDKLHNLFAGLYFKKKLLSLLLLLLVVVGGVVAAAVVASSVIVNNNLTCHSELNRETVLGKQLILGLNWSLETPEV